MMTTTWPTLALAPFAPILAGLILVFGEDVEAARGRGCGAGCQRTMGSCSVNSQLWNQILKVQRQGVRATSCCRSAEYNQRLRACGYNSSPSSSHTRGEGVDLAVGRGKCTSSGLAGLGLTNVCPYYHDNHCHVSMCGSSASGARARESARERIRSLGQQNQRSAYVSNYRQTPRYYYAPYTPRTYYGGAYNDYYYDDGYYYEYDDGYAGAYR